MRPWYKEKRTPTSQFGVRRINQFSKEWGTGAPVVKYLIVINLGLWLLMVITNVFGWLDLYDFWYMYFAMSPDHVLRKFMIYQIVTSMFMHDGSWILHVIFNMYFLWMFGTRIERTFGSRMFLIFYLVCGLGGSLLSVLTHVSMGDWYTKALGASGAVFGIFIAYGFLFSNEIAKLFGIWSVKIWKLVAGLVALEVIFLIFQLFNISAGRESQVDHWAHLGGALASVIWMLVLQKRPAFKVIDSRAKSPGIFVPPQRGKGGPARGVGKLFRVIVHKKPEVMEDHPEGTDDEPPPDWFKMN